MFLSNRFKILIILSIIVLAIILLWVFTHTKTQTGDQVKSSKTSLRPLGSNTVVIPILFDYVINTPENDTCIFDESFAVSPAIFGTVININNGSNKYKNSIMSFSNVSASQFTPQIYQTWPIMGINWLAIPEISLTNFEVGIINSPEGLVWPYNDEKANFIAFKTTFDVTPIVILSQFSDGNYAQNREFGVYNVTSTGFFVTWYDSFDYADSWPSRLCYIAINPNIDANALLQTTDFVLETGSTSFGLQPVLDDWVGGIELKSTRQYTPVVLTTACFDENYMHSYQKNIHMNTTVDTVSRKSFHISVNEDNFWVQNGRVNWLAISRKDPTDANQIPVSLKSYYKVSVPRPTTTTQEYFFIENQISNPIETTILASSIGVVRTNDVGYPLPSIVKIYDISSTGFVVQINDKSNIWPVNSGIQYTIFERNPHSNIENKTLDHGVFQLNNINPESNIIVINFNIRFNHIPKIFTAYNWITDNSIGSRTAIIHITTTYFILQYAGFFSWNTPYHFDTGIPWVAIDDQEPWSFTTPFQLSVGGVSTLDELKSDRYALTNNPRLQTVFGFIPINESIMTIQPNVFISTNVVKIDSIYKDFFHINTPMFILGAFEDTESPIFPIYWFLTKPEPAQPIMEFTQCTYQIFIDPDCPIETIENEPDKCEQIKVEYIPKLDFDYFETITELAPEATGDFGELNTDEPIDLDGVVICNIYLKKATLSATSEYGIICQNSINHLNNEGSEIGGYTQWLVNADYGYFSKCKSVGNVLIRINSDFASTNPVTLEFYGMGYCPSFQYYIQWGTSYDQIKGPFAYDAVVEYTFGRKACGELDVFCTLKANMESACYAVVYPLASTPYNFQKSTDCDLILAPAVTASCIAITGGPENIIGDAMCASIGAVASANCKKLISEGYDDTYGPDYFAHEVCNGIFK